MIEFQRRTGLAPNQTNAQLKARGFGVVKQATWTKLFDVRRRREILPDCAGRGLLLRGEFHDQHGGVDIFAPLNTPLRAVERGEAWSSVEPKGGNVVYLRAVDGKRYFYGHLNGWATKLFGVTKLAPVRVEAGEPIGFVGNTGNAEAGRRMCIS